MNLVRILSKKIRSAAGELELNGIFVSLLVLLYLWEWRWKHTRDSRWKKENWSRRRFGLKSDRKNWEKKNREEDAGMARGNEKKSKRNEYTCVRICCRREKGYGKKGGRGMSEKEVINGNEDCLAKCEWAGGRRTMDGPWARESFTSIGLTPSLSLFLFLCLSFGMELLMLNFQD